MKKVTSFIFAALLSGMFVSAAPTTGLQFSGAATSIIELGVQPSFSPTQITLESWVNYQTLNGGGYIISTEGGTPDNHGFSLRLFGDKLEFAIGYGADWPAIQSSNPIITNQWFHVAVVYTGTELKMYINGVQDLTAVITKPITSAMTVSTEKLTIGESPAWTGRRFIGQLGDLRFWNVVRTPAEIASDMTSTLVGTEAGLVAGWKMNEGAGTNVADITGVLNITKPADVAWFGVVAGLNTVTNNSLNIASAIYGRNLSITNNTNGNAQFAVYSVTGQKIMEDVVASGATSQKQLTNAKGAYILKTVAADGSSSSKKFIIAE